MLILAHRGASRDHPENTLPAFQGAVEQGADGVELDAMACASGEVVVCHDEVLHRLAGVALHVNREPWWKLKRLDVGRHLGGESAKIPLLREVIELLPAHFLINIELKCETWEDFGLCEGVADLVRACRIEERVVISSFNPLCLWRIAQLAPALRRGFLIDPDRSFFLQNALVAPLVSTHSIHPHHAQITPERARTWRALGLKVAAWTVDDSAEAARLKALSVAYCITNTPAALRAQLNNPT